MTNWDKFILELNGIETITEPERVAKLSLDYYHFSPVLQPKLEGKRGDLVACPNSTKDVLQIAKTCVKHQVPLTVRGAGTGNYGQCIPLQGGVILDTTKMNRIVSLKPGVTWVEPGVRLATFDKQAREIGWELRMYPSTYRTATIGGFIGGGSGGIGSINYGGLSDRGNILAVKVVTLEKKPRLLELRGAEVQQVNHAYGTNGIITQLEIPLARAYPWAEVIATFNNFMDAAKFGHALADADGLIKKLISVHACPIPSYFTPLQNYLPQGKHCTLLMVAEACLEPLQSLVAEYKGQITYQKLAAEAKKGTSLAEFTWNHTTLHGRSIDNNLTYLQSVFPYDPQLKLVEHMYNYFGEEVIMHLEFMRSQGRAVAGGLQLVRYTTEERLQEIIAYHEAQGVFIANPHTYILEDGGNKMIDEQKLEFKKLSDPFSLLNPGKMRGFQL